MTTKYVTLDERNWFSAGVRGIEMKGATLWNEGFGLSTRVFRMPAGMQIPVHRHDVWLQVAVLSGQMKVRDEATNEERIIDTGGVYFIQPGTSHAETAVVETEVLVTKQEPDPADAANRLK